MRRRALYKPVRPYAENCGGGAEKKKNEKDQKKLRC